LGLWFAVQAGAAKAAAVVAVPEAVVVETEMEVRVENEVDTEVVVVVETEVERAVVVAVVLALEKKVRVSMEAQRTDLLQGKH
jgi:hypothetical protein